MTIVETPDPPYFAVVLTTVRTAVEAGYADMADEMYELAAQQPGFLGMEFARSADGFGITVSYWRDLDAIRRWRELAEHAAAQRLGQEQWYTAYRTRICRVEREYGWQRDRDGLLELPRAPWTVFD